MTSLSIITFPLVGLSKPPIQFNKVVLPDPEGPTTAVNSPSDIFRSTLLTALTSNPPWLYILLNFLLLS